MINDRMDYGVKIRRKRAITAIMVFVFASALVSVSIPFVAKIKSRFGSERKDILRLWEAGSFDQAFSISGAALESKPMDYFMLTIHGFAAYQLGISQINSSDTLRYIDDSIRSLRKALLFKNAANDGRVHYVLGKAYSYKGDSYADLAIKYLEMAGSLSYTAADIPEYLGLAYAAIGDYRGSVAAFSQALEPPRIEGAIENTEASPQANNPPDMLLLSIARSYSALDELDPARAYLLRCIEVSPDSKIILAARLLLGDILRRMGDISGAEGQYTAILSEAGENAEAHYQLGELYTRQGDTVRARSEWRLAVKTDPSHTKARTRLNM